MFGESVFALIPDHEVRAAKLTNRWISGCWWGRHASSDEHLGVRRSVCSRADQFEGNLLWSSGAAVNQSRLKERNGILMLVWKLEYLNRPWNHVETKRCHLRQHSECFSRHLLHNLAVTYPKCEDKECMRNHSGSDLSGPKLAGLLDAQHVRRLVRGSHTLVIAKHIKMLGRRVVKPQQRRRRSAE